MSFCRSEKKKDKKHKKQKDKKSHKDKKSGAASASRGSVFGKYGILGPQGIAQEISSSRCNFFWPEAPQLRGSMPAAEREF